MHTSTELRSEHFEISVDGRPGTIETLFADFDEADRLGIVIAQDWGGAGASTVILAAVTAFYDRLRAGGDEFFAYPDHFAFHLVRARGTLRKLDVFPEHKEVVVADEPEQILRAINDRAVTRLLVPDRDGVPGGHAAVEPFTRASAERRIRTALAYSPTGRTAGADVRISGSARTESYVGAMLELAGADRIRDGRAALLEEGRPVESFRRISLAEALLSLGAQPPASSRLQTNT